MGGQRKPTELRCYIVSYTPCQQFNIAPAQYFTRVTMPPKDMSFPKKSPAEQLLALQPQDIWPIISVSWNPEVCELQFGVRHYAAATDVKGVKATDSILSASALWWAVTVGTLLPLDASTLVERDPIHYWGSYQDSMIQVVAYIKGAGPGGEHQRKVELQSLAAAAVADYN